MALSLCIAKSDVDAMNRRGSSGSSFSDLHHILRVTRSITPRQLASLDCRYSHYPGPVSRGGINGKTRRKQESEARTDRASRQMSRPNDNKNGKEGKPMNYQAIVNHGSELKKIGIGLVGAGIVAIATACSAAVLPAPNPAPAPTVVPITASSKILPVRSHSLEMFRYTQASSETSTVPTARQPLEMFRYTASPVVIAPSLPKVQPFEMCRCTSQASVAASLRPVEFVRYADRRAVTSPPSGSAQPLEIFRRQPSIPISTAP